MLMCMSIPFFDSCELKGMAAGGSKETGKKYINEKGRGGINVYYFTNIRLKVNKSANIFFYVVLSGDLLHSTKNSIMYIM